MQFSVWPTSLTFCNDDDSDNKDDKDNEHNSRSGQMLVAGGGVKTMFPISNHSAKAAFWFCVACERLKKYWSKRS